MTAPTTVEDLLRLHAPQVLGALVRRYGHFDAAEDAVQEALLAAAGQWPRDGVPANPRGWLIRVAARRLADALRAQTARTRREETAVRLEPREVRAAPADDDTLTLLFLCCDPVLAPAARIALTLRAVGGLTTAEIARAHLVPEATVAQRVSRAKAKLRAEGADRPFRPPDAQDRDARLGSVLQVLYLMFNEGYTATSGPALHRADLAREAIRLTREARRLLPREGAVTGLLALILLTEARSAARTGPGGELVPLDEQDRALWDRAAIAEGTALVEEALAEGPPGPYQLQAAIAALHDEAAGPESTDWPQILALYDVLVARSPTPDPMAELGRVVALAMVEGPEAGLAALAALEPGFPHSHRLDAVRAHLLERTGARKAAADAYRLAARTTLSLPERRYLQTRAARLDP
ncbi:MULTISPECIES: sigma-70 family RNA polymerase sigma factor [unclassified Streptomyces]|uniref:RNA polymerase sigma factor n=1 Tax=unclassified Streptomyces TaxID=2593676 RepID=UPI002E2A038F|nr:MULTISPECIES: sigma-70 family RNA polymerase sigma factor [unclassified Streptomyces]